MSRTLRSIDSGGRVVVSADPSGSAANLHQGEFEAIEIADGHELRFESATPLRVQVERLHLGAGSVVSVCAPLDLDVRSLDAQTPSVVVVGPDGAPGPNGWSAPNGPNSVPGGPGNNGGPGGSAYDIILTLPEISGTFTVLARGGLGGRGGNGGSGQPGGRGGDGGPGGNGSRVTIRCSSIAPDTSFQIDDAPADGGDGGAGGAGTGGGPAGLPGRRGQPGIKSEVRILVG